MQPGGRAVIQAITIPDRKYKVYRYSCDWIRKHIFPGGHLPSIGAMSEAMASSISGLEQLGANYATTIDIWRRTLQARRKEVMALGYDEAFLRK